MEMSPTYMGREHSWLKHKLLESYLEKLLFIKGMSGTTDFVYIDCFAGPWGDESESLEGTSISISLKILLRVRDALTRTHGISGVNFKAIYVEESSSRYARLSNYLEHNCPNEITYRALHGDYAELQDQLLEESGNESFAFFFVDPMGWSDVAIPKLRGLLQRQNSEFLITFMYDFLNRAIGMADFREQVSLMLGELKEQDLKLLSSSQPKEREEYVVRRYREKLKSEMDSGGLSKPRSYHAKVLHREKSRTLYHLVYLSRHHKGIVEFARASEKFEFLQRIVRLQKEEKASRQLRLFPAEDEAMQRDISNVDLNAVKKYWLESLERTPTVFDESKLAEMLEETGWLISDFEAAFKELLIEKKVENLDSNRRRPVHPIQFEKSERIRRCI